MALIFINNIAATIRKTVTNLNETKHKKVKIPEIHEMLIFAQ